MKKCSCCRELKKYEEFSKDRSRKDGLRHLCKICDARRTSQYYADNRDKRHASIKKRAKKVSRENKFKILEFLKNNPCVDCGEANPLVLEFDHVRGTKKTEVCRLAMKGYCWETVKKEIDKCEVRCANCHRIKTIQELGWNSILDGYVD